eukprot:gnl/Trimastix_PCT/1022.p1 GENE.gnl/Trimastix_PCT/1022~~gnl/Trimastix_PCT/1022.p1  ORF type:complete len:423 (-),score=110.63 gnl/Trimastix_PCT/1022:155-1423(-)
MGKTFVEKLLARKAGLPEVVPGQIVTVSPDHLLTHDNTAAIFGKIANELEEFGIHRTDLNLIVLDHIVPACNEKAATDHKKIRTWVKKHGIENFYDVGHGICHQVVVEEGHALPGGLICGSDSHTCSYGAVNCFSTGIDRTEAASMTLTGQTWLRVPHTIKVVLTGQFRPGVGPKDLVLTIIGNIGADGASYHSVEFHGPAVASLSVPDRFTISNMGVEMDAKCAVFPFDEVAREYLTSIGVPEEKFENATWADEDASYARVLEYNLADIQPCIAAPHKVDNYKTVAELSGLEMNQFFLGTCTNGRAEDLRLAASILNGHRVHPSSRLIVAPASLKELQKVTADGTLGILLAAGAMVLPPGCGPCLGAHGGCLAPAERCLSTANRNFKGRMGCKEAEIYLASPQTVAASCIRGCITDPGEFL